VAEFNLHLNDNEVATFLEQIHVDQAEPSSVFLADIVSGIVEHVPFQNITMLTGPRHRPSEQWIKDEMMNGLGGLCTARNPFLHSLLRGLGFEVRFVSSTILEPDCHISLVVNINDEDWWVDVGNGYPYFSPIRLGDETPQSNWFFSYRLVQNGSRFELQHAFNEGNWVVNHHFSPDGVDFSVFDRMHELHYKKPGWGPFLTGLRVNRYWADGGAVLKDHRATSPDGDETLHGPSQVLTWLKRWFEPSFWNHIDVNLACIRWKHDAEAAA
jgi:arylamine N-acetyltransferase